MVTWNADKKFSKKNLNKTNASKCRSCGADIIWQQTQKSKNIPCDPKILKIVTDEGEVVSGRSSHFASCPHADEWRHRK